MRLLGGRPSNYLGLSTTAARSAITPFKMPSMSPTMEEGKISSWKVSPGQSFQSGDVLLSALNSALASSSPMGL